MAENASDAPLSVDDAVNLLAAPEPAPEPAADEATNEGADAPEETEASPTEAEDVSEDDAPGDDVETAEQPEAAAVDAPQWWDAEKRAIWATLTPAQQAAVAEQEAKRETVTAKAKEEAAAARKAAEAEMQQSQGVLNALASAVPQWVETFKSRWDGVDWVDLARNYPAEQINEWRFQYEAEAKQINEAQQYQRVAEMQAQQAFYRERTEQLPNLAPELADPVKGEERQVELSRYLLKSGASAERIRSMDALEMAVAYKAMKYDTVQQSIAKPKPAAQKTVAPTAPPTRSSKERSVEQLTARLERSKSVDDAVALLQARRK